MVLMTPLYDGFDVYGLKWPTSGPVIPAEWNADPAEDGGLYGVALGSEADAIEALEASAIENRARSWALWEADKSTLVESGGGYKAPRGVVRHVLTRDSVVPPAYPDLAPILRMKAGDTHSRTLFDSAIYFEDPGYTLFTVCLFVFRGHNGAWTIQLLEAQEACPETHPYTDRGNVFEYWGEREPSLNGGFVRYVTDPEKIPDVLTVVYAKVLDRHEEMADSKRDNEEEEARRKEAKRQTRRAKKAA